jgi:hypothetical protein
MVSEEQYNNSPREEGGGGRGERHKSNERVV